MRVLFIFLSFFHFHILLNAQDLSLNLWSNLTFLGYLKEDEIFEESRLKEVIREFQEDAGFIVDGEVTQGLFLASKDILQMKFMMEKKAQPGSAPKNWKYKTIMKLWNKGRFYFKKPSPFFDHHSNLFIPPAAFADCKFRLTRFKGEALEVQSVLGPAPKGIPVKELELLRFRLDQLTRAWYEIRKDCIPLKNMSPHKASALQLKGANIPLPAPSNESPFR